MRKCSSWLSGAEEDIIVDNERFFTIIYIQENHSAKKMNKLVLYWKKKKYLNG